MRMLEFVVDKQRLRKKPGCDFSNIVSGSVGYLKAIFSFSEEWDDCKKAASFWVGELEYAILLDEDDSCLIPMQALTGGKFGVSVSGGKKDYKLSTNRYFVRQEV